MIKKYKKLPVVIEAVEWNGFNFPEILTFVLPREAKLNSYGDLFIETLEGNHNAITGDYIIKGVEGETYPCKAGIFHKTYEEVK